MKRILFILIIFITSIYGNVNQNYLLQIAYKTKDKEFINDVKQMNNIDLNIDKKTKNRKFINKLYKKYPKYKKYIYVNFDTNSKNIDPFNVQQNDLKVNHSKYIILKNKKDVFFNILTKYYFAILFTLFILYLSFYIFLKENIFKYSISIIISFFIILTSIYYYLYNSLFNKFNKIFILNLDYIIFILGICLTIIFTMKYKKDIIIINGLLITISSFIIIKILKYIYI